jgi:hypothetical protein
MKEFVDWIKVFKIGKICYNKYIKVVNKLLIILNKYLE